MIFCSFRLNPFSLPGFCVGWTGEFAKPSYKGDLRIEDKNGSHHLIVQFSSKKMVAEFDNFSKEPTPESYSLLLSSSPCGGFPWEEAVLGYMQPNETLQQGIEDLTEAKSVRLLHCPEEPCLLLVNELDCAPLAKDSVFVLSIEIIIVLAAAGLIFVVIVICIPIIYCCIKSRWGESHRGNNWNISRQEQTWEEGEAGGGGGGEGQHRRPLPDGLQQPAHQVRALHTLYGRFAPPNS